ncbi:MAG: MBL fold metallo-hydrolase [Dehalococcoidales bacterium]
MKITILGAHNNETSQARCTAFLIDKSLAVDAGALTSSLTIEEQQNIKAILLTHGHFDHIKDIPLLGLNLFRAKRRVEIYSHQEVYNTIKKHLLNGNVYPPFHRLPAEKPTLHFHRITVFKERKIENCRVLAMPVNHTESTLGYRISDAEGKALFYTSDTGTGFHESWQKLAFQLLMVETTFPNRDEDFARLTKHLTPNILLAELTALKKVRGELPRIVVMHRDPLLEHEVKNELAEVAASLKADITIATEGMQLQI